ncbi:MAG: beta-N-acetylhexosaminidase [Bacteroidota bacterium]|nr:beta-N-acetylhexosaminidase [Bacteroidota bacterium]
MKNKLLIAFLFLCSYAFAQQCPIIPLPNHCEAVAGSFIINSSTPVIFEKPELQKEANYLQQEVLKTTGLTLSIQSGSKLPAIFLNITRLSEKNASAYNLEIRPTGVRISGSTEQGVFYGLTSLMQLVRQSEIKNSGVVIPCWNIKDAPRFQWRGLMLDESRHFFGTKTVKNIIDWMAYYKFNKFHWHLTDMPGWRIEIKAYPLLTLVGGVGNYTDHLASARYYTQEEIREIVAYAKERFIDVIPEIDMPGHATAANKAYPAYSGGGSAKFPEFTFNPGKDSTYLFLSTILKETDALFPSQMIHLGGDEVHFGNEKWNQNEQVKQLMQKNNLADLVAVERYFTKRMADSLFVLNNKVLLWDEAADSDLPRDKTIIFWWRHDRPQQLKKALDNGFPVVMCPRLPFYFDYVQDSTQRYGGRWDGKFNPIDKLYNFSTSTLPIGTNQYNQIMGIQANLWTESMQSKSKLEYMLFPRITALAEDAWTNEDQKDLTGFKERVKGQLKLYKKDDVYYYNPFNPSQTPEPFIGSEL